MFETIGHISLAVFIGFLVGKTACWLPETAFGLARGNKQGLQDGCSFTHYIIRPARIVKVWNKN